MTYDAATGNTVLFGTVNLAAGTWTWDGSTWTQQAPATSPPARYWAAMTYDAATGNTVLFGGRADGGKSQALSDTWTWNGSTWTQQAPAVHPPALWGATMAYDAATGTVVLFGGTNGFGYFGGTWTWNGTTWTRQAPAKSPAARQFGVMAYDAAAGNLVLFGGSSRSHWLGDTWTWDGSTWTRRAPASSPSARIWAAMTYDVATGNTVLFGGAQARTDRPVGDTWTWDGTNWTRQALATHPQARAEAAMTYDAATGNAVLFGGTGTTGGVFDDTWTWG